MIRYSTDSVSVALMSFPLSVSDTFTPLKERVNDRSVQPSASLGG